MNVLEEMTKMKEEMLAVMSWSQGYGGHMGEGMGQGRHQGCEHQEDYPKEPPGFEDLNAVLKGSRGKGKGKGKGKESEGKGHQE